VTGTHDWFYVEADYTTPAKVTEAFLELRMLGATGTAWFDGVCLEELGPGK